MCVSACIIYNTYPPHSNPDFTTIVMAHAKITTSCYFKKAFFVFVFSIKKKKKKQTNKQTKGCASAMSNVNVHVIHENENV